MIFARWGHGPEPP